MPAPPAPPAAPAPPPLGGLWARARRLQAYELLIFAVMVVLFALCLVVAPVVAHDFRHAQRLERAAAAAR